MIGLLVAIAIGAVIYYIFNLLIPLPPKFRAVLNVLLGLFIFLFILDAFGLWHLPGNLK